MLFPFKSLKFLRSLKFWNSPTALISFLFISFVTVFNSTRIFLPDKFPILVCAFSYIGFFRSEGTLDNRAASSNLGLLLDPRYKDQHETYNTNNMCTLQSLISSRHGCTGDELHFRSLMRLLARGSWNHKARRRFGSSYSPKAPCRKLLL